MINTNWIWEDNHAAIIILSELGVMLLILLIGLLMPLLAWGVGKLGDYLDDKGRKEWPPPRSWPPPIHKDWHSQWKRF